MSQAALLTKIEGQISPAMKVGMVVAGVVWLALLAQVRIPLPWTPVPITGQTFGVSFLALLLGAKFAASSFGLYLVAGAAGLPVFAGLASGLAVGPTAGYLVGMWLAAFVVGTLADRGWVKTFPRALLATYAGSLIVFSLGLVGLSFFLPQEALLAAGLWPFLPGDLIKNLTAAGLATYIANRK